MGLLRHGEAAEKQDQEAALMFSVDLLNPT
jgi:hypothetical protein